MRCMLTRVITPQDYHVMSFDLATPEICSRGKTPACCEMWQSGKEPRSGRGSRTCLLVRSLGLDGAPVSWVYCGTPSGSLCKVPAEQALEPEGSHFLFTPSATKGRQAPKFFADKRAKVLFNHVILYAYF